MEWSKARRADGASSSHGAGPELWRVMVMVRMGASVGTGRANSEALLVATWVQLQFRAWPPTGA